MTWTAAIMPDDALPDDSLVGRMLKPAAPPPATATPEPMPLWLDMEFAGLNTPGTPRDAIAAEIEALRDWLVPEERTTPMLPGGYEETRTQWEERQRLRAQLTEQASIARGEP